MSKLIIIIAIVSALCIYAYLSTKIIPDGHRGVVKAFGVVQDKTLPPGLALIFNPSERLSLVKHIPDGDQINEFQVTSKEGIVVTVSSVTVSNSIDPNEIPRIIKIFGDGYDKKLVTDLIIPYFRELSAERTVDQIQITDFHLLDNMIKDYIQKYNDDLKTGVEIQYVRINSIDVPEEIKEKRILLAQERNNILLAEEKEKVLEVQRRTDITNQENEQKIKRIFLDAELVKAKINNQILIETAKANLEKTNLETEGIASMFKIPGYLNLEMARTFKGNTKVFWGDKLPSILYPRDLMENSQENIVNN